MSNIINSDLSNNSFSDSANPASVSPIYKKDDTNEIKSYRPVSILNCFSKICRNFLNNNLYLSFLIRVYVCMQKWTYYESHVLIWRIENRSHAFDNNLFTGTVLILLLKTFDCILQDLITAKLHAYGLDFDTVTILHNYPRHRKQSVKINSISSFFRTILSGVPQGSILGQLLFKIFVNHLFFRLAISDLHNFADNNTIAVTCKNLNDILHTLEKESE